jgi:hypothetical protein
MVLLFVLSGAVPMAAQESRSTILGTVSDAQGAVVAGASVTVMNLATNEKRPVTTNQTGYFEVPLLNAGRYQVTAELTGFKKTVRGPIDVGIGASVEINFALEVGNVAETVTVTGEAPILETSTASSGRVIASQQITELPIAWRNPMLLLGLAPGMVSRGNADETLPWNTGAVSNTKTMGNGDLSPNQISLDGATIGGKDRAVGYIPNLDSVAEFKMELMNFDAAVGHSSGAFVNMSTKAGTNQYHGSLFEQHWQQRWNATPHFTRLAWEDNVRRGAISPDTPKQPSGRSNQFGASAGGPIRIPKVVDGRDRAFFFFSYGGIYQTLTETGSALNRTVPKAAWRQGDFSDLLAIDPAQYQIYDPRTARLSGGRVIRDPFPNNRGIPVLNPMYDFYAKLYPQPNNVAGIVDTEGRNNYYALGMPKVNEYNNFLNRIDLNLAQTHRLSGKWYWSHYLNDQNDWTFETLRGLQSSGTTQYARGFSSDYTWTLSGRTIFSLNVSATQFVDGRGNSVYTQYKPSDVGLPAYMDDYAGDRHHLPRLNFSTIGSIGGDYPGMNSHASTGQVKAGLVHVAGSHTWKVGWEERRYWRARQDNITTSGQFTFGRDFVRSADNDTRASNLGLEWAAFMMAVPTNTGMSGIDFKDSGFFSTPWRGLYAQDDIRLGRRMRLSVGARLEWEGGSTERYNRGQGGGFDFATRLAFSDAVEAAYAKNPIPGLPASQFKARGGAFFLGQNAPRTLTNAHLVLLPRVGFVYQLNPKTVLRAGTGWYGDSINVGDVTMNQLGYSVSTSTTLSNDNGLTFCCDVNNQLFAAGALGTGRLPVTNPFPIRADGTRWETPYGNALGAAIFAGRSLSFFDPDFKAGRMQRWRIGVQRELRRDLVLEGSYNGSYVDRPLGVLGNTSAVNYLPASYYSTTQVRNTAVEADLNTKYPNPFLYSNFASLATTDPRLYNYLRTQSFFTSTTVNKGQLLRPYPLFGDISGKRPGDKTRGVTKYHDLQIQLERRMTAGLSTSVMYTHAGSNEKYTYQNPFDAEPIWEDNGDARPHLFVWLGTYDLPFGKGKPLVQSGPLRALVSGWQVSWMYKLQSGISPIFSNQTKPLFYYGDIDKIAERLNQKGVHKQDIHLWWDPTVVYQANVTTPVPANFVGFEGRGSFQPAYNVNYFPIRFKDVRADALRFWNANIKRDFRITEGVRLRFGIDLLNLTNHTNFKSPNLTVTSSLFGRVTSQDGTGRMVQAHFRMQF